MTPLRGVLAYHIGGKQSASIGHWQPISAGKGVTTALSDDALKIVMRGADTEDGAGRIQVRGKHK